MRGERVRSPIGLPFHKIWEDIDDCPVFDGLFEYCSISAGGSMGESPHLDLTCSTH